MSIKDEIVASFKKGDAVAKLIYINLAVYLLYNLIYIINVLFLKQAHDWTSYFSVPANISLLLTKPWTLFTYMFLHKDFFHILFNILNLYWFGRFFLMFFNQKQLIGLYIIGGIFGAAFYLFSYNFFPYFEQAIQGSLLIGASASILALTMAVAAYQPNMEIQLVLIGRVKLKYLAAFVFFVSLFSVVGENAGGNLAHLGGLLAGYLFALSIKRGKDLTAWLNRIIDFFVDLFARKPKMKVSYGKRPITDAQWNAKKQDDSRRLDNILDKIKKSGYESLSTEEKKMLFDQSSKT